MKSAKTIQIVLLSILAVSMAGYAVENPNVPNSSFQSNNTVPSQGRQQRRINQPISGGNNVVTGNVAGNRYFRGVVPYGSTYYTGSNLYDSGSRSVNSFVRRSVNPVASDRNPGQVRPYYQPSRTTSTFRQQTGIRGTVSASSVTGRSRSSTYDLPSLPPTQVSQPLERPLSANNLELDMILSRQSELKQQAKLEDRTTVESRDEFKNFFEQLPPDTEQQTPDEQEDETEKLPLEQQILQEYQKEIDEAILEQESVRTSLQQQRLDALKAQEALAEETDSPQTEQPDPIEAVKQQAVEKAEAAGIRGEHKTFSSLAESRFSDYMTAAQQFVVEGKYYKAADAYELAMIWQSDDPRPYAGKAFSLFAAGEYMSSTYYLNRAIELNTAMAAKPVDIAKLMGDRDTYENRLLEITTWQQRSGSGELAFLLAYLYHHDGKSQKAETAIATAVELMGDSHAVKTVNNVINSKP
ncbi:MAG: hypothetical protein ACYSUT_02490 [Planctomycetota bacterium]|jgi:hypothetical protein